MYVQAYQIDNVLNVYRKQLSQKTKAAPRPASLPSALDRVSLSQDSQRQSIINQISADIVQRIARHSQENRLQDPIEAPAYHNKGQGGKGTNKQADSFSYTLIDENNQKQTNIFQFNNGGPFITRGEETEQQTGIDE